jgi:hypothetical protein
MSGKEKGRLLITINGVSLTRAKWAERLGVTRGGISWMEHARGMTPEQAVRHFYLKRRKPRNCDRYATVDEAMDDFADKALIEEWNALKAGKDRDMLAEELFVFTRWLFAPATEQEGGAK